jgi:hypothetical protein
MSSEVYRRVLELDATELEDLVCAEGRAWLEAIPPCIDRVGVIETLRLAIAAWHAHELEQDPLPGLEQ